MINQRTLLIIVVGLLLAAIGAGSSLVDATSAPGQLSQFIETAQLFAPDGQAGDHFGTAVDVDGDTMVVGTTYFSYQGGATEPDAAYVFVRDGGAWSFQAKLTASDGTAGDRFGNAVAIEGDTILVGAYFADVDGNEEQGAAYVFTRSGDTWTEQGRLTAGDGVADDQFGWSVSLSGDTALVGTDRRPVGGQVRQGAAYVFTRSGNTWSELARLSASDGADGDQFGYAVAVSGSTAVVGARGATVDGNNLEGAAYIFADAGSGWTEQTKLSASDGDVGDGFGTSVALDDTTVIIGAEFSTLGGYFGRGAAYVFTGAGAGWSEQDKLIAGDYENNHGFGQSVAVDGDTALVGTPSSVSDNENQGAAYVFTRSNSLWSEQAKLTPSAGAEGDLFGENVALNAGTALVGAPRDNVNGNENQGSAYIFGSPGGGFTLYLPAVSG